MQCNDHVLLQINYKVTTMRYTNKYEINPLAKNEAITSKISCHVSRIKHNNQQQLLMC